MNMRELKVLLSDFIHDHKRIIIIFIFIIINILGFLFFKTNTYKTYLFYPDLTEYKLLAEKRKVINSNTKIGRIKNTIDELLLGPLSPEINDVFPKKSKLISAKIDKNVLYLNFSKNLVMDISLNGYDEAKMYYIVIQSIVNSIYFQNKDIKLVKFYFNGKEYRYLGNYGPINNGFSPDIKLVK